MSGDPQSAYPHLFAPGEIGGVAIRNRVVQPPMGTGLMEDPVSLGPERAVRARHRAPALGADRATLLAELLARFPEGAAPECLGAAMEKAGAGVYSAKT
jgi:2,4-dienoyl-CoA reductase-like NADH-dependent reductase (Old Yellow Enzyme family)